MAACFCELFVNTLQYKYWRAFILKGTFRTSHKLLAGRVATSKSGIGRWVFTFCHGCAVWYIRPVKTGEAFLAAARQNFKSLDWKSYYNTRINFYRYRACIVFSLQLLVSLSDAVYSVTVSGVVKRQNKTMTVSCSVFLFRFRTNAVIIFIILY